MQVLTSQRSGDGRNADRVLVTDNAVLVLDGASAFEPVPVDPGEYAKTLGHAVAHRLDLDPESSISDIVADGITSTARALDLREGHSPSSTIAVLRVRGQLAEMFVLGDSPIYYGSSTATHVLRDDRLSEIAEPERASYVNALRAGRGYNAAHRDALSALQRVQREHRNTAGGYWIAETDPAAAHHALSVTVDCTGADWAILGTDGVTDHITATGQYSLPRIAAYDQRQLNQLLADIHHWEREVDPNGQQCPRAKRHDDKTLAVVPHIFASDRA